jgi:hypothetical protein
MASSFLLVGMGIDEVAKLYHPLRCQGDFSASAMLFVAGIDQCHNEQVGWLIVDL